MRSVFGLRGVLVTRQIGKRHWFLPVIPGNKWPCCVEWGICVMELSIGIIDPLVYKVTTSTPLSDDRDGLYKDSTSTMWSRHTVLHSVTTKPMTLISYDSWGFLYSLHSSSVSGVSSPIHPDYIGNVFCIWHKKYLQHHKFLYYIRLLITRLVQ